MCTEFDSDGQVTVEYIKTLAEKEYVDMFMEYKNEQQCKHLGFDTGGLVTHADSILQDEFDVFFNCRGWH